MSNRQMKTMNKKGQISIGDAPMIVLMVGLVFLLMATIAMVSSSFGNAVPKVGTQTVINETLTTVTQSGEWVSNYDQCAFSDFTVLSACNATGSGVAMPTANYTVNAAGGISMVATETTWNNSNINISYTYDYGSEACNITSALNTEINENTSIAGIILTISLVGIVLSILIGVFLGIRKQGV